MDGGKKGNGGWKKGRFAMRAACNQRVMRLCVCVCVGEFVCVCGCIFVARLRECSLCVCVCGFIARVVFLLRGQCVCVCVCVCGVDFGHS